MATAEPLPFTYWSDPLCIWAYVAQRRLENVLRDYGMGLAVHYRVVPVFGSVPERFATGSWSKSGVEGRVRVTRDVAQRFGHDEVSGEGWAKDAPASSWGPGAAIKAVFALAERGDAPADAGPAYQWAMRKAFFVDDRNVARRDVQLELAEAHDIPRGPLEQMLDDGSALALLWVDHRDREAQHVQGSPTWVFDGGREMLYGNVAESVVRATIDALSDGLEIGRSAC